jgi:hypothetical protein
VFLTFSFIIIEGTSNKLLQFLNPLSKKQHLTFSFIIEGEACLGVGD